MVKPRLKQEVNSFIKGLITESSPLNFPNGSSKSEYNFEINKDGSRDRRLGLDFSDSLTFEGDVENLNTSGGPWTYLWESVSSIPGFNVLVIVRGPALMFYDADTLNDLSPDYQGLLSLGFIPESITSVDGRLVCAGGTIKVVSYVSGVGFSAETITLKTRDVWGVEEATTIEETDTSYRNTTISTYHRYNLQNQSWGIQRKDSGGTLVDPVTYYNASLSKYPSNSEAVWAGLQFQPVAGATTPYERIFPNMYDEVFGAVSNAAKGYFIIDLLDRGASRAAAVAANLLKNTSLLSYTPSFVADQTPTGPTVVGAFAGRVWYAGFSGDVVGPDKRSPFLGNMIAFSKLVKESSDYAKCYQEGDPTSRDSNSVTDTDGGFIKIIGMSAPIGMIDIGDALIVIAENGVWSIKGGSDAGFTATNYFVERISFHGSQSKRAIVKAGDKILFFGEAGIFAIEKNQYKDVIINNVSVATIHSKFVSIPSSKRGIARGAFDSVTNKVRWIIAGAESDFRCLEIVLDMDVAAFTLNRIESIFVSSVICVPNVVIQSSDDPRYVTSKSTRFLVIWTDVSGTPTPKISFASYSNYDFQDRNSTGGYVDALAHILTGDNVATDSSVFKQVPYLTVHMLATETGFDANGNITRPSGCLASTRWNWALSDESKKIGPQKQVYRPQRFNFPASLPLITTPDFEVVTSKNKVLGRGRAFALHFETEPLKDCRLIGWSNSVTGNKNE